MFDVRSVFAALRRRSEPRNDFERGLAAFDAGHHEQALAWFEAAVAQATDPATRAVAHNKRGVVLVALGRRNEALDAFGSALDCEHRCAPALANIGNLLLEDGHLLDAVDYYDAALRADAAYAVAHRNLGIAYRRLGRPGDAVRALRAAARLEGRRRPGRA
jgi:tetratricopeptide (TPR) repeat protein